MDKRWIVGVLLLAGCGHSEAPDSPLVANDAALPTPTVAVNVAPAPASATDGCPAGATAVCTDGTISEAEHHQGACSHHGGVARWCDEVAPSPAIRRPTSTPLAPGPALPPEYHDVTYSVTGSATYVNIVYDHDPEHREVAITPQSLPWSDTGHVKYAAELAVQGKGGPVTLTISEGGTVIEQKTVPALDDATGQVRVTHSYNVD